MPHKFPPSPGTYQLFIGAPCYECGRFHWDCLHHIMGDVSNSPYNFLPINNHICHLNKDGKMGRGDIRKKETRLKYLKITATWLRAINYHPSHRDQEFIKFITNKYVEAKDFYN